MTMDSGQFVQKGWGSPREDAVNKDRKRWYGFRPGDIVGYNVQGAVETGYTVVRLHALDNNGCTIRKDGREFKIACEWLIMERQRD